MQVQLGVPFLEEQIAIDNRACRQLLGALADQRAGAVDLGLPPGIPVFEQPDGVAHGLTGRF